MSFWGATVITNLLSAIPVFGHDLVESIQYKIFLSGNFVLDYLLFESFFPATPSFVGLSPEIKVDDFTILSTLSIPVLPSVGIVSPHAFKKGVKKRLNKLEYLSIPYQFLSYLVGLIDGDGYISIIKTTKGYIKINLTIQKIIL